MATPQITIGQSFLGDAAVYSVVVEQELNRHWHCTIVCRQPLDSPLPVDQFIGQGVAIQTAGSGGEQITHFAGLVHDVELGLDVWGTAVATLRCISSTMQLDVAPHKKYWPEKTLPSIASTIQGLTGIGIKVSVPAEKPLNYVQYGETDFNFLARIIDDHKAWFRPSDAGMEVYGEFQSGATLTWRDTDGLVHFQISAELVPPSVSGSHYDHHASQSQNFQAVQQQPQCFSGASQYVSAAHAASQALPSAFESNRARAMTLADYQQQLQAESERFLGNAVVARGVSRANQLKPGDTIDVEGLQGANGTYGLLRVTHTWGREGYSNSFTATTWKHWRHRNPPSPATWSGMVSARVVAHNDPKKMGRVQVRYFWQQEAETHWARLISPHAGHDRGMMMMPEIGDEVAVLFEDGDPERPLIVGALWNGVHQQQRVGFFAPTADIPDNNIKRFITRSGNRMQFIDTPGQETLLFATPHSANINLTEKSTASGVPMISLSSAGDILLSAPNGRVHIKSKFFSREVGDPSPDPPPPPDILPESQNDGVLIGQSCTTLTQKLKPNEHLSRQQVSNAWGSAFRSDTPCCQAMRASGKAPKKIVYTNGIKTTQAAQCTTLQIIANSTCASVIGVHNATGGPVKDLAQSLNDKSRIARQRMPFGSHLVPTHDGTNPATDSLTDVIVHSKLSNDDVTYFDHSQGGAITSNAMYQADNELKSVGETEGVNGQKVINLAGAAQAWHPGLDAEHYINDRDLTPSMTGLGRNSAFDAQNTGPNQVVYRFSGKAGDPDPRFLGPNDSTHWSLAATEYHGVDDTYMNAYLKKHPGCPK